MSVTFLLSRLPKRLTLATAGLRSGRGSRTGASSPGARASWTRRVITPPPKVASAERERTR